MPRWSDAQLPLSRLAFEHSPEALLLIELDSGEVQVTSRVAQALISSIFGDAARGDLLSQLEPRLRARLLSQLRDGLKVDEPHLHLRSRDGKERRLELRGAPVFWQGHLFAVLTLQDRDQRCTAEREQLEHLERLSVLGRMAAGVAHEINNPATYVLNNLELLQRRLSGQGAVSDMSGLVRECQEGLMRIAHIARELNYYSGAGQGEMETVSLDQIAREALLLARPTLPATLLLEAELDELPGVMGNRRRLVQVAINLLNNAAHASSGRGLVRLRTRAEGEWMMLEVIDQGCGIPPGLQEKIFEPFFTTKPAGQGTGLGLWLARGIVDGHRGELSASSSPGRGTTFTMRLPRPTEATRVAIEQLSSRPPEARSARIMVVDDQPAIRRTMERLLAPRHQVVLCDGGQEALKTLELDEDFDLIFCDMQMPFVNGAIFYQRLRSHQPQLAPRVVFMSGLDVSADLGVDLPGPHLEKPFSPATLNKVINLRLQALDFPEASCAASR